MEPVKKYGGKEIEVTFDASRCLHSAECLRGLPSVFDLDRRPWVDPDGADAARVAEVVTRCPSGALQFRWPARGIAEEPGGNVVSVGRDGPLYLRGDIVIRREDAPPRRETRVALCRCGASANKPFCDGSHARVGFRAPGTTYATSSSPGSSGELIVTVRPNGPLRLEGPYRLDTGETTEETRGSLCRCGQSERKPVCDGSHRTSGFRG